MHELRWSLLSLFYLISLFPLICANNSPKVQFSIYNIERPQMIGIIAGCSVFVITIIVVIYLLYASGTIHGMLIELQNDLKLYEGNGMNGQKRKEETSPQNKDLPRLYDHLIEATKTLPLCPTIPRLSSVTTTIRLLDSTADIDVLFQSSNGNAIYHESAYNPERIWGWLDIQQDKKNELWNNKSSFSDFYKFDTSSNNFCHIVIEDKEILKPIGAVSLTDNVPSYLSVRVSNIWITPAYQGKKKGYELMFTLLTHLFSCGYRRITAEIDTKNIIAQKFFRRCGFILEATFRKHKIIDERNQDTALYVILNSEWDDIKLQLMKLLSIDQKPKGENLFHIPSAKDIPILSNSIKKDN